MDLFMRNFDVVGLDLLLDKARKREKNAYDIITNHSRNMYW